MARSSIFEENIVRLRILMFGMLAVFGFLLVALWNIQVAHGSDYQADLIKQSVRRVRIPGIRGRILDRHERVLADNIPSYGIAIYLEELRQPGKWPRTIESVVQQINELSQTLGRSPEITEDDIWRHIRKRLPLPLLAWKDIDEETLARFSERASGTKGVDIYVDSVREYPYGPLASHIVGYVGRADPQQDESEPYHYYLPEIEGKTGVEKRFDEWLRGEAGGRLVRVDVSGFRHDDLAVKAPKPGSDVVLAIDVDIQNAVERALEGVVGAGVVIDPSNGDVLAMASTPGYNPNSFATGISRAEWGALINDETKPLLNRATVGAYPPGSTFKPVVAMAALVSGKATPQNSYNCPGYFKLGRATFKCWYRPGHGMLDMTGALKHSCNVYMFHLGLLCGHEHIVHMADAMGFGHKTDIDLDYEVSGLLPDDAWKRRTQNDAWRDGDTCNLSIGQGYLLATPLQVAMEASVIANEGHLYRPRLVLGIRDPVTRQYEEIPAEEVNDLHWEKKDIDVIRKGMWQVVNAPDGTGRLAVHPFVQVAGKTGTAEYGPKKQGRKLGWMIAFAPYEDPKYAIAMVIEDAGSGGSTTAPRMGRLFRDLFLQNPTGGFE